MSNIIGYNVYLAPEGCDESFLWDTARTAGHCGGMHAPAGNEDEDGPIEWFGPDGHHCAVAVYE